MCDAYAWVLAVCVQSAPRWHASPRLPPAVYPLPPCPCCAQLAVQPCDEAAFCVNQRQPLGVTLMRIQALEAHGWQVRGRSTCGAVCVCVGGGGHAAAGAAAGQAAGAAIARHACGLRRASLCVLPASLFCLPVAWLLARWPAPLERSFIQSLQSCIAPACTLIGRLPAGAQLTSNFASCLLSCILDLACTWQPPCICHPPPPGPLTVRAHTLMQCRW